MQALALDQVADEQHTQRLFSSPVDDAGICEIDRETIPGRVSDH